MLCEPKLGRLSSQNSADCQKSHRHMLSLSWLVTVRVVFGSLVRRHGYTTGWGWQCLNLLARGSEPTV